jgi:GNAT superfamily N-acetyltransferase/catechol 2,3-dioxygenase-like lactoylglutathione lyase family enzyme
MRAIRLFEAHLTVRDVERSVAFYRDVVGLPVALLVPERGAAFLWVGGRGESMLGLWSLGSAPVGIVSHVAFRSSTEDVLRAFGTLRAAGVEPRSFFGEETDEPSVIGWMPAAAVYFLDPDGHQLEYLAMLDEPARPEVGIVPWSEWASAGPPRIRVEPYDGPRSGLRPLFAEAEDSAAELDAYIDAGQVFVARLGDAIVGHLQLIEAAHGARCEIKNMAVAPSQHGRGIGRALVAAAVESARASGDSTIVVATAAADVGNLRFYQRCGFRLRSVERDVFTAGSGYAPGTVIDGIELRDRVWLDLDLKRPPCADEPEGLLAAITGPCDD